MSISLNEVYKSKVGDRVIVRRTFIDQQQVEVESLITARPSLIDRCELLTSYEYLGTVHAITSINDIKEGDVFIVSNWGERSKPSIAATKMLGRIFTIYTNKVDHPRVHVVYEDKNAKPGTWNKQTIKDRCLRFDLNLGGSVVDQYLEDRKRDKMLRFAERYGVGISQFKETITGFGPEMTATDVRKRMDEFMTKYSNTMVDRMAKAAEDAFLYGQSLYQNPNHNEEVNIMNDNAKYPPHPGTVAPAMNVGSLKNFDQFQVTLIRGRDAKDMTDAEIQVVLNDIASDIERRERFHDTKYKAKRIDELKLDLQRITDYLDSRYEDQ